MLRAGNKYCKTSYKKDKHMKIYICANVMSWQTIHCFITPSIFDHRLFGHTKYHTSKHWNDGPTSEKTVAFDGVRRMTVTDVVSVLPRLSVCCWAATNFVRMTDCRMTAAPMSNIRRRFYCLLTTCRRLHDVGQSHAAVHADSGSLSNR